MIRLILLIVLIFSSFNQINASLTEKQMQRFVEPPMELGTKDENLPIWKILNSGGDLVAYIFESADLVPIPGFSGGKINLLISIDLEGNFLDVLLLEQNEPVFVAGLGVQPFIEFLRQYRGKSLASNIKIADDSTQSSNIQIDNITKATASVKIANESILASAIKVAREKLAGVAPKPVGFPDKKIYEKLSWEQLIEKGLVNHLQIKNNEVEELFKGSEFEGEDSIALDEPDETYLDLWVADLGIPTVGKNILTALNIQEVQHQLTDVEEGILVLANGRHQLVSEDFVRNTVPNSLEINQDGYPISIRDADLDVEFLDTIPNFEQAMIFQADTRFGFDPSSPWLFKTKVIRKSQFLYSNIETRDLNLEIIPNKTYFLVPKEEDKTPVWLSSWKDQAINLTILIIFLISLFIVLFKYKTLLEQLYFKRTILLIFTLFFIGWYAQGQLSIVTVLGLFKTIANSQSLEFLLYDPISLVIWFFVIISLFIWGRGTFCGWLCPYGVLQELSNKLGKVLKFPQIKVPPKINDKLVYLKYFILGILVFLALYAPTLSDSLVEVEPFKTSITLQFDRSWPYVLYALFWIVLSMFIFKGFCRFICPLGAFYSLLGRVRIFNWLPRRKECGNPCHQCSRSCEYEAIDRKNGKIKYEECFQCLVCVDIHHDDNKCAILKVAKVKVNKKTKFRKAK